MKTIQVRIKSVYGRDNIYPVCSNAKVFASLAGTQTLTKVALTKIKDLGYTIEVVQDSIQL